MIYNNKGSYIILALLLLSVFSVYGLDFKADLVTVNSKITIDQVAEFRLTIYNNDAKAQSFRVKNTEYPNWDIRTVPSANPILVDVPPLSNKTITLIIDPNKKYVAPTGGYFVNFDVIAESNNEALLKQARISLVPSDEIITGYVPTVTIKTDFQDKINPSNELNFKITLTNQNNLNITKAKLTISSEIMDESFDLDILPKEEKIVSISKKLDPKTKPASGVLTISLDYKGKNIDRKTVNYEIVQYCGIDDITKEKKSFLRKSQTITFTNKGNVKFKGDLLVITSSISKLFGSTSPKAETVKDGKQVSYLWTVELDPYESYTVTVSENYLGIFILLIAIILIAVLIFLKRSPIIITKQVTETESSEGGLSRMNVLINIKNRSSKKIPEISIVDKIPKLLEVEKHTTIGSLKPSRIKRTDKHETLILWSIDELTAGEERVINYYLKSNLDILGGLTLQSAMAKFRLKDKEVKVKSNKVSVKGSQ